MLPKSLDLYKEMYKHNTAVHGQIRDIKDQISQTRDLKEFADLAYVLKQSLELNRSVRQQLEEITTIIEKVTAAMWSQGTTGEPIRTEHCTCTPRIKIMASLPSQKGDPENFAKMMKSIGVAEHLWNRPDENSGGAVVRPHWPAMVEYVSELAAQGKPLPDGIDPEKTYSIYKLTIRPRKELEVE